MHPALRATNHRPWPIPANAWSWRQKWHQLLFAHWEIPIDVVRRQVPEPLAIDQFEGKTYVGVVPFHMSGVMRRPLPDIPWLSAFPELNVRVYVTHQGKPGVWFLSLDASNPLAVWAARRGFHLPYWHSRMEFTSIDGEHTLTSHRHAGAVDFSVRYRPISPARHAKPGTLEHFLVERYCLYCQAPSGRLHRCEINHAPWPIHDADAAVDAAALLSANGLTVAGAPLLHYSEGVDVVVWSLEKLADAPCSSRP